MPEQPEAGAVSRLTEWVSDVEAGHDTVGADPLTTAILRRRADHYGVSIVTSQNARSGRTWRGLSERAT